MGSYTYECTVLIVCLLRAASLQSAGHVGQGLQLRHHEGVLQGGQIRRVRRAHEDRPGAPQGDGRQAQQVDHQVPLAQGAVLRLGGHQVYVLSP